MTDTKTALIYTYAHLPQKLMFLANPPKNITKDKYNDTKYLERVFELVEKLQNKSFRTRTDGVLPYTKAVILKHLMNRIFDLKGIKIEVKE